MTLRRNQLKKMTLDEIMIHLASQTDADSIKMITGFIGEKNDALLEKKNALLAQISDVRIKMEKSIKNLNGRVKDRIDKKETIIMDKDSRPTTTSMTELMSLFAYLEDQGKIITRNNNSIKDIADSTAQLQASLRGKAERRLRYDDLDRQYEELNAECKKEEAIRDALLKERDEKRTHYANIDSSIESYRKQYQKVQSAMRIRERELIQLSGYYQARTNEDKALLEQLPARSLEYQQELLSAQEELNACRAMLEQRRMMQIQGTRCGLY